MVSRPTTVRYRSIVLLNDFQSVQRQDITFLHPIQQKFISKCLQRTSDYTKSKIISFLHQNLIQQNIKGIYKIHGQIDNAF